MDFNLGALGPLVSVFIQALKVAGVPARFLPMANIVLSLGITLWAMASNLDPVLLLTNFASLVLATAGTYEIVAGVQGAIQKRKAK